MRIDTRQIPEGGFLFEGEESPALLDLHEEGIKPVSPLRYRLYATLQESELLLEGSLETAFELHCVRCLEPFRKTIRLDPYRLVEDLENPGIVDLTDRVREDILLDLPAYPKCEGADTARTCPQLGRIPPESRYQPTEHAENEKNVWEALDDLDPDR